MSAVGFPRSIADAALRLLTAAALVIDAVIHLRLAPGYQLAAPDGVGEGNLFRVEAVVAVLVAALVLVTGHHTAYRVAFLVAASATAAALLYRYYDIPAFGPIPAMYEPVWFDEKLLATAAEAVGAITAAVGWALNRKPGNRPAHAASADRGPS